MHVSELNEMQKDTLRWNIYYDELPDNDERWEHIRNHDDITDEMLEEFYGHIDFVNDDFGCSMGED